MSDLQSCFKRYEKKYLLTPAQYDAVRRGMTAHMKPDAHPRYTICNIYYDTENYDLIRASLEKPVYKEKLRLRSYGVPGTQSPVFVELKKKFDGVVYKRRVTMEAGDALRYLQGKQNGDGSQIGREIDWFLRLYRPEPKVMIAYDREAWAAAADMKGDFVYAPTPLMGHRIHRDSTTTDIIESSLRTQEDLHMLKKFWPDPVAERINAFYRNAEKSNR